MGRVDEVRGLCNANLNAPKDKKGKSQREPQAKLLPRILPPTVLGKHPVPWPDPLKGTASVWGPSLPEFCPNEAAEASLNVSNPREPSAKHPNLGVLFHRGSHVPIHQAYMAPA